jgi:hypothetical protein
LNLLEHLENKNTPNNTFAIGGVSYSLDSLAVVESFVLQINICAEKPVHRNLQTVITAAAFFFL